MVRVWGEEGQERRGRGEGKREGEKRETRKECRDRLEAVKREGRL